MNRTLDEIEARQPVPDRKPMDDRWFAFASSSFNYQLAIHLRRRAATKGGVPAPEWTQDAASAVLHFVLERLRENGVIREWTSMWHGDVAEPHTEVRLRPKLTEGYLTRYVYWTPTTLEIRGADRWGAPVTLNWVVKP